MGSDYQDSEAPFNMAVATLMRLDAILQQIRNLHSRYPFDSPEKQKSYLELVTQFYINAIPLLKVEDATKSEGILFLKIEQKKLIRNGVQRMIPQYSGGLDLKLNRFLIELQQLLRKYFMPKGRDLGRAVAHVN